MIVSKTEFAELAGVSLPTVDAWARAGMPVQSRGVRGAAWRISTPEALAWLRVRWTQDANRLPNNSTTERQITPIARQTAECLALPLNHLVPWAHEEIVELAAYAEEINIEPIQAALYGCPLLPPSEPDGPPRVSVPHADRWRALLAIFIETAGGDALAPDLAAELGRLRGVSE